MTTVEAILLPLAEARVELAAGLRELPPGIVRDELQDVYDHVAAAQEALFLLRDLAGDRLR